MDTEIKEFVEIGSLAYDHIHTHAHTQIKPQNTASDEERIALFFSLFLLYMYWDARSK